MRERQPPNVLPSRSCGDRVRALRLELGLTQIALSDRVGWNGNSRLANYESGRNVPDLETVRLLAVALGCSPGYLAFGGRDGDVVTLPEWCSSTVLAVSRSVFERDVRNMCWGRVGAGGGLQGVANDHDVVLIDRGFGAVGSPHALRRAVGSGVTVAIVARDASGAVRTENGTVDAKTVLGGVVLVIHAVR